MHTKDILTYDALQSLHREISLMRVETTKKQILAQSQRIFEQGERTGRLLACLAKERSSQSHIAHIKDDRGKLCSDPADINEQFAKYYKQLYTSTNTSTSEDLHSFLNQIEFPQFSDAARSALDAPITLKEVQMAVGALQSAKTPGPDGLPAEFYKEHRELLVPKFHDLHLKMLGGLPTSIYVGGSYSSYS